MMYKDRPEIKQRSDSVYSQVLKEQALILKKYFDAHENKEILKEVFLPASELSVGNNKKTKMHAPKHEKCSGIKKGTSTKLTEKRICRCMFYYCKKSVKCQNCLLINKWHNVGEIKVTNYEWPTTHVYKKTGGMDLILDNEYAVEVKPKESKETLTRMIAEILTYTLDCEKDYKPGICFFEGSKQMEDFEKYKSNADFQYILKFVKPFYIKIEEDGIVNNYKILPYE